jgi:hypothetical protein
MIDNRERCTATAQKSKVSGYQLFSGLIQEHMGLVPRREHLKSDHKDSAFPIQASLGGRPVLTYE